MIYLYVPTAIRLSRLKVRERERLGVDALRPGGKMHDASETFLEWAAAYDDGNMEGRSRRVHEQWLETLPCRYVRLEGTQKVNELLAFLEDQLTL